MTGNIRPLRARVSRSLVSVLVLSLMSFGAIQIPFAQRSDAATLTSGNCSINTSGTGGVEVLDSTTVDGTCMVRFTSGTNGFTLPAEVQSIRTLVVGGGGGGGFGGNGGGGGAGAVIYSTNALTVTSGAVISVSIGGGGAAGINDAAPTTQSYWAQGTSGTQSSMTIAA